MDINEFAVKRPYLYHLTDARNIAIMVKEGSLFSTNYFAAQHLKGKEYKSFIRSKREDHCILNYKRQEVFIRDQKPISLKVLNRSLTPGLNASDFIELLNSRVFLWPTISRLKRHYKRYERENPIILKFRTTDLLIDKHIIELARLNTGATRCSHFYNGNAPTRGKGTFLSPENIEYPIGEVAEFTVLDRIKLPKVFWTGSHPEGDWNLIELD